MQCFKMYLFTKKDRMSWTCTVQIKDYCLAAIPTQLKVWFPGASQTLWSELKCYQIPGDNLYNYLLSSHFNTFKPVSILPTIQATLLAWQQLINTSFVTSQLIHSPLPIPSLSYVVPDLNVTHWVPLGISKAQIEYGVHAHDY